MAKDDIGDNSKGRVRRRPRVQGRFADVRYRGHLRTIDIAGKLVRRAAASDSC